MFKRVGKIISNLLEWLLRNGDENLVILCGFYFKTLTRSLLGLDKHLDLEKLMDLSCVLEVGRG